MKDQKKCYRVHAHIWEKVRQAEEYGTMSRREAEAERQRAATLIQQAWSCGYKRACEVGGAIFVRMALTPYDWKILHISGFGVLFRENL